FSSRRRHTRWPRDWSSDVCSSDLWRGVARSARAGQPQRERRERARQIEELLALEEDVLRRQDRTVRIGLEEAVPLARVRPEALRSEERRVGKEERELRDMDRESRK